MHIIPEKMGLNPKTDLLKVKKKSASRRKSQNLKVIATDMDTEKEQQKRISVDGHIYSSGSVASGGKINSKRLSAKPKRQKIVVINCKECFVSTDNIKTCCSHLNRETGSKKDISAEVTKKNSICGQSCAFCMIKHICYHILNEQETEKKKYSGFQNAKDLGTLPRSEIKIEKSDLQTVFREKEINYERYQNINEESATESLEHRKYFDISELTSHKKKLKEVHSDVSTKLINKYKHITSHFSSSTHQKLKYPSSLSTSLENTKGEYKFNMSQGFMKKEKIFKENSANFHKSSIYHTNQMFRRLSKDSGIKHQNTGIPKKSFESIYDKYLVKKGETLKSQYSYITDNSQNANDPKPIYGSANSTVSDFLRVELEKKDVDRQKEERRESFNENDAKIDNFHEPFYCDEVSQSDCKYNSQFCQCSQPTFY